MNHSRKLVIAHLLLETVLLGSCGFAMARRLSSVVATNVLFFFKDNDLHLSDSWSELSMRSAMSMA